jgi:putative nucleotidyltransferase with HDIG domain
MCRLARETVEQILSQGRIYEVGGAVRDRLLGYTDIKDRDYLVTGVPYDRLSAILSQTGRVDLVGRSFGVIKFTQSRQGQPYTFDIALPRKEFSTGHKHTDFAVDFDPSLPVEDDLLRRDFTVNAMALDLTDDVIIDPLDGRTDLENKRLRMTSQDSFTEDPLRMLRAVQFAARFGFDIEEATLEAIRQHAPEISTVSSERVAEELNKLLEKAEKPSIGFCLMKETGLLDHLLPELAACVGVGQPGGFHKYDVFEHTLYTIDASPQRLRVRTAALFHDINKPQHRRLHDTGATFYGHESSGAKTARDVLRRFRYSTSFISEIETLVERHMFTTQVTGKGMRRLIRRVGTELVFDLLDLRRADVVAQGMGGTTEDVDEFEAEIRAEIDRKPPFGVSDLAVDGNDLMRELDLAESPAIGIILDHLLEEALDEPDRNSREEMLALARKKYDEMQSQVNRDKGKETD